MPFLVHTQLPAPHTLHAKRCTPPHTHLSPPKPQASASTRGGGGSREEGAASKRKGGGNPANDLWWDAAGWLCFGVLLFGVVAVARSGASAAPKP